MFGKLEPTTTKKTVIHLLAIYPNDSIYAVTYTDIHNNIVIPLKLNRSNLLRKLIKYFNYSPHKSHSCLTFVHIFPFHFSSNFVVVERFPAPLSSNASTPHAINSFSISCVLPFQLCSAPGFCIRVSAAVSNTPFLPNFTNSIFLKSLNLP